MDIFKIVIWGLIFGFLIRVGIDIINGNKK